MEHTWRSTPIDLPDWLRQYALNRYGTSTSTGHSTGTGTADSSLVNAWGILRQTVYNGREIRDGAESILTGRPTFDSFAVWTRTKLNYESAELLPAWDVFVRAATENRTTDGFDFDLTDITRQVLANYALPLQQKWVEAFRAKDKAVFTRYSREFIELMEDMDRLLATRRDFLLGPWIAAARSWGITAEEKHLYEKNARDLITLWGDANSPLHEYANRQWSGLINDFYKPRWEKFFALLDQALTTDKDPDLAAFEKEIRQWEWEWVNEQKTFPVTPTGDSRSIVRVLYKKYRQRIGDSYK
jgi:alpha-N-acetylglucosaminidase